MIAAAVYHPQLLSSLLNTHPHDSYQASCGCVQNWQLDFYGVNI